MLPRSLCPGLFVFLSASVVGAADPAIPPAPSQDLGQAVESPGTAPVTRFVPPPAPEPGFNPGAPIPSNLPAVEKPGVLQAPVDSYVPQMQTVPRSVPQSFPQSQFVPDSFNAPSLAVPSSSLPSGTVLEPGSPAVPFRYDPQLSLDPPKYNTFSSTPSYGPPVLPMSNPGLAGGEHPRYPYYSYRRPWYTPGPVSRNVNIIW